MKLKVLYLQHYSIEGIPLITRFKTLTDDLHISVPSKSIEGIPLITRFKTIE